VIPEEIALVLRFSATAVTTTGGLDLQPWRNRWEPFELILASVSG
jgi:hypothetical protein